VRANDTEVRTGERIVVATWRNIFSIHYVYAVIVAAHPDRDQW